MKYATLVAATRLIGVRARLLILSAFSVTLLTVPEQAPASLGSCAPKGAQRTVSRSAEVIVLADEKGSVRYETCSPRSGDRTDIGARPPLRLAGAYALIGRRGRPGLGLLDVATGEATSLSDSRRALEWAAVDARGRAVWRLAPGAAGRATLRARAPAGRSRPLSRARDLSHARLHDGVLSWRANGVSRSRRLGNGTCAPRPGARIVSSSADATVLARTLRFGAPGEEPDTRTDYWGCLRADGRQRRLATVEMDAGGGSSVEGDVPLAGPFAAISTRLLNNANVGHPAVTVRDLRDGTRRGTLSAPDPVDDTFAAVVLGSDGRALALTRHFFEADQLFALTTAGDQRRLDEAPGGQIDALRLDVAGVARWRTAGEPRSAPVE